MAAANTQGTIKPSSPFSAEKGAQDLRKAMKGIGTDEAKIIEVMANHSNQQRQEIAISFKTQFGKGLLAEIKSEISGRFQDLVEALLEKPIHFDAKECKEAIKSISGTGILFFGCVSAPPPKRFHPNFPIRTSLFKRDLEEDIMGDTSGHLKRLLVSRLAAGRQENAPVDTAQAREDAQELYEAGANQIGTDESVFNKVLCLRSYPQLVATFDAYRANYGKEIEEVIKGETSGYLEDGLLAVVALARNTPAYFAERLYKCMKGAGTKDQTLIRVVVSRSEIDLAQIKKEFQRIYGKTLGSFIKDDTSGDYEKLLLAICKES